MELMLDMQKRFKEKLNALRQENCAIKAQRDNQEDKLEKDENVEDLDEEEEDNQKKAKSEEQSSKSEKLLVRQKST